MRRFTYAPNYDMLFYFLIVGLGITKLIFLVWINAETWGRVFIVSIFCIILLIVGVLLYRYLVDKMQIDMQIETGNYKNVVIHELCGDQKTGYYFCCIDMETQKMYESDRFDDVSSYHLEINDIVSLYMSQELYWIKLEKVRAGSILTEDDVSRAKKMNQKKDQSIQYKKIYMYVNIFLAMGGLIYSFTLVFSDVYFLYSSIQTQATVRGITGKENSLCYTSNGKKYKCTNYLIEFDINMPSELIKLGFPTYGIYTHPLSISGHNQLSTYNTGHTLPVYVRTDVKNNTFLQTLMKIQSDFDNEFELTYTFSTQEVKIKSDFNKDFDKNLQYAFFALIGGIFSTGVWFRYKQGK